MGKKRGSCLLGLLGVIPYNQIKRLSLRGPKLSDARFTVCLNKIGAEINKINIKFERSKYKPMVFWIIFGVILHPPTKLTNFFTIDRAERILNLVIMQYIKV